MEIGGTKSVAKPIEHREDFFRIGLGRLGPRLTKRSRRMLGGKASSGGTR
jgi:hypothetical protein